MKVYGGTQRQQMAEQARVRASEIAGHPGDESYRRLVADWVATHPGTPHWDRSPALEYLEYFFFTKRRRFTSPLWRKFALAMWKRCRRANQRRLDNAGWTVAR